MSKRRLVVAGALLATILSPVVVLAVGVTLNYYMPEMFDPHNVLTFTNTNALTVTGSDLAVSTPPFPNVKGIEIHSEILGAAPNTVRDITAVQITFHYGGLVNAPVTMGTNSPLYAPWVATGGQTGPDPTFYTYTFTKAPASGSAPINDNFVPGPGFPHNQSFATATITGDSQELGMFSAQNPAGSITVTPSTTGGQDRGPAPVATPEFGSIFSLGGLLVAGCTALWLHGRRRRAAK